MPRIAKSEREKHIEAVARRIHHHYSDILRERELDCHEAAKTMGMSYYTLNNRMKTPAQFTLGELYSIANAMNVSLATLISGREDTI